MDHDHTETRVTTSNSFGTYGIDTSAPLRVNVTNDAGSVKVAAVDRADLLVRSSLPGVDGAPGPTGLRVTVTDQAVTVCPDDVFRRQLRDSPLGSQQTGWMGVLNDLLQMPFLHRGEAIDIEIEVPVAMPEVTLAVTAASGDLDIAGIRGPITIRSASGDIRVRDTIGALRVETASGDLGVSRHHGRLQVAAASGDLRVDSSEIDEFSCNTANGDVVLDRVGLGPTVHKLNTVSGDVALTLLPSGQRESTAPVGVVFSSVSGDARLGPGFARLNGRAIDQVGEGQAVLRARTVSGDLSARLADDPAADQVVGLAPAASAPMLEPSRTPADGGPSGIEQVPFNAELPRVAITDEATPVPEAAGTGDRMTVLRQLQEGIIGVDEAMRLLEGVEVGPGR